MPKNIVIHPGTSLLMPNGHELQVVGITRTNVNTILHFDEYYASGIKHQSGQMAWFYFMEQIEKATEILAPGPTADDVAMAHTELCVWLYENKLIS